MAYSLMLLTDEPEATSLSQTLFDWGAQGVEEQASSEGVRLLVYAETRAELEELLARVLESCGTLIGAAEISELNDSWQWQWLEQLQPVELDCGLVLVPRAAPEGDAERDPQSLYLEPAMAFGFGEHPTTLLLANWLAKAFSGPQRLLDVGCGTGVLSLVAARSGAGQVCGIDIDAEAVRVARENAQSNGLHGSVRFGNDLAELKETDAQFDVAIANIELNGLLSVAPLIAAHKRRGTRVALSGLLQEQVAEVQAVYAELGIALTVGTTDGDWVLLVGVAS